MKKRVILLIDDDAFDVVQIKRTLEKLETGHELFVAGNGIDALAFLNGNSSGGVKVLPDIILLDLSMPEMGGLEFLGIIRNYYSLKNIKIYVMTGSSDEVNIALTQNMGVAGYILKPLNFDNDRKDNFSLAAANLKKDLCGNKIKMLAPVFLSPGVKTHSTLNLKAILSKKIFTSSFGYFTSVKVAVIGLTVLSGAGLAVYQVNQPGAVKVIQGPVAEPHSTNALLPKELEILPIVQAEQSAKVKMVSNVAGNKPLQLDTAKIVLTPPTVLPNAPKQHKIVVNKIEDDEAELFSASADSTITREKDKKCE